MRRRRGCATKSEGWKRRSWGCGKAFIKIDHCDLGGVDCGMRKNFHWDTPDVWTKGSKSQPHEWMLEVSQEFLTKVSDVVRLYGGLLDWNTSNPELCIKADYFLGFPIPASKKNGLLTMPREFFSQAWNVIQEYQHTVSCEWAQSNHKFCKEADKVLDDLWFILGGREGFFGAAKQK